MTKRTVRIVIADTRETVWHALSKILRKIDSFRFNLEWINREERWLESIRSDKCDLCLLGYNGEEEKIFEMVGHATVSNFRIPLIVISDRNDYHDDLHAMLAGATAYLIREEVNAKSLERSIRYALQSKQIEEELRVLSSRMDTLVNNLQTGILFESVDRKILYINKPFCKMFAVTKDPSMLAGRDSVPALKDSVALFSKPEKFNRDVTAMIEAKQLVTNRLVHLKDGRILDQSYTPVFIDNVYSGHIWQYHDVTHNKEIEAELNFSLEFNRIINMISTSFINLPSSAIGTGINVALEAIGEFISAERGILYILDKETQTGKVVYKWAAPSLDEKHRSFQNLDVQAFPWSLSILQQHGNIFFNDIDELPESAAQDKIYYQRQNVKSLVVVPMVYSGELFGCLAFSTVKKTQKIQERVIPLLVIGSEMFVNAIEREKVEQELRISEERYALVVRSANDGIWDWNIEENKVYYSPRWKMTIGYEEWEIGHTQDEWFSRVHPDDIDRLRKDIDNHLARNTWIFKNEHRILHKDGTFRWALSRGIATFSPEGAAMRMVGSLTDITARKIAEEKLKQKEEEQRFRLAKMEEELMMARTIQQQLLPKKMPRHERYVINAVYYPAEMVGGDYYAFVENKNFIGIFLGDVSGHGVPSALITSMLKVCFDESSSVSSTASVLENINKTIYGKVENYFLTAFYLIFDLKKNVYRFSSAGHNASLIVRDDQIIELNAQGGILGPFKDEHFEEVEVPAQQGDRLLLYTDGIVECYGPNIGLNDFEIFGEERLYQQLIDKKELGGKVFLHSLLDEMKEFSGRKIFNDDATAVLVDIL